MFFSRGGALPAESPSYLERPADHALLEALLQGEYALVLDSRQKGKSSLLVKTASRLNDLGFLTLKIDLQGIGSSLTELQWYAAIARAVGEQVDDLAGVQAYWREETYPSPAARWLAYVEKVAREEGRRTVVFIDEVDFVRSLNFDTDEFFAVLAAAHNRRGPDSPVFCLSGTSTPTLLLRRSFPVHFILGRRIELTDFTLADLQPYAEILGSEKAIAQIHGWTGGQPFLTQIACGDRLAEPEESIDDYFRRNFVAPRQRRQNDHIASLAFALTTPTLQGRLAEEARTQVLDAYIRVLHPRGVLAESLSPEVVDHLLLTGVAKIEGERLQVRNRLYREALDRNWARDQISGQEKARQARAARRATIITTGVAALILMVVGGFAVSRANLAQRLAKTLAESEANALRAQQEAYVGALQSIGMEAQDGNSMRAGLLLNQVKDSPFRGWEWRRMRRDLSQHDRLVRVPGPAISWREDERGELTHIVGYSELFRVTRNGEAQSIFKAPQGVGILRSLPSGTLYGGLGDQSLFVDWAGKARELPAISYPWGNDTVLFYDRERSFVRWLAADGRPLGPEIPVKSGSANAGLNDQQAVLRIDGGLALTDLRTGKQLQVFAVTDFVSDLVFDAVGKRLYAATDEPAIRIFSVANGQEVGRLKGNAGPVRGLALNREGTRLASAGADGSVRLFDLAAGTQIRAFMGHENRVQSVGFSLDGKHLVSAGYDGAVRTWNLNPDPTDLRLNGAEHGVARMRFAREGKFFVGAFDDGTIKFWRPGTAAADHVVKLPTKGPILISNFDGQHVEGVTESGLAFRTDGASLNAKDFGPAVALVTMPNAESVWVATKDGRLLQGDWGEDPTRTLREAGGVCTAMAAAKDRRHVVLGFEDGSIELWQTQPPKMISQDRSAKLRISSLEFSPDSSRFAATSLEGTVYEHSLKSAMPVALIGHTARVWRAHYSPDGKQIATSSFDNSARVWESGTGKPLFDLQLKSWVGDVQFSPDGKRLLTACGDGTARIWSIATARELLLIERSPKPLFACRMTADGNWIVTSDSEGRIRAWNGSPASK